MGKWGLHRGHHGSSCFLNVGICGLASDRDANRGFGAANAGSQRRCEARKSGIGVLRRQTWRRATDYKHPAGTSRILPSQGRTRVRRVGAFPRRLVRRPAIKRAVALPARHNERSAKVGTAPDQMSSCWTNFARGSNSNGKRLPAWPMFTEAPPLRGCISLTARGLDRSSTSRSSTILCRISSRQA